MFIPPESVAVFDDDRRHLRIGEQTADLCPSAVHARADLGLHSGDRQPGLGRPLAQAGDLPVEIGPLVVGRDSGVETETIGGRGED